MYIHTHTHTHAHTRTHTHTPEVTRSLVHSPRRMEHESLVAEVARSFVLVCTRTDAKHLCKSSSTWLALRAPHELVDLHDARYAASPADRVERVVIRLDVDVGADVSADVTDVSRRES